MSIVFVVALRPVVDMIPQLVGVSVEFGGLVVVSASRQGRQR
ncbi:hypothetical protein [Mycolicibacterium parafortuitum]|nr:hypothetical protein [Mycolicibacterium parafortuitum]